MSKRSINRNHNKSSRPGRKINDQQRYAAARMNHHHGAAIGGTFAKHGRKGEIGKLLKSDDIVLPV